MGFLPGLKAFTAAVFGGIGNLAGAMVGGVLLGVIEALGSGYIGDAHRRGAGQPVLPGHLRLCRADHRAHRAALKACWASVWPTAPDPRLRTIADPTMKNKLIVFLLATRGLGLVLLPLLAQPFGRQLLGAHAGHCAALRAAGPGPEHRGGLCRPARPGLRGLLRGGRLTCSACSPARTWPTPFAWPSRPCSPTGCTRRSGS